MKKKDWIFSHREEVRDNTCQCRHIEQKVQVYSVQNSKMWLPYTFTVTKLCTRLTLYKKRNNLSENYLSVST